MNKYSRRKGFGLGKGKGYKNIIKTDPIIHSRSAKGLKTFESISQRKVTLSPQILSKWKNKGNSLIREGLITGYQLEDFSKDKSEHIYYGHTDKKHIKQFLMNLPEGVNVKIYPRKSGFKWDEDWGMPSKNTELTKDKKYASETGYYLKITGKISKVNDFINKRAVDRKKQGEQNILFDSWEVPDVRLTNTKREKFTDFKKYKNVIVDIDEDTRFSTLLNSEKAKKLVTKLENEKIKKVFVQDYKPQSNSFYYFLQS